MKVRVRNIKPRNHQADPFATKGALLGFSNALGNPREMCDSPVRKVQPMVDFDDGNDQDMAPVDRIDVDKRNADIVTMHECPGDVAVDDLRENCCHRIIVDGMRAAGRRNQLGCAVIRLRW